MNLAEEVDAARPGRPARNWPVSPSAADDLEDLRIRRARREAPTDWPKKPTIASWPDSRWQLDAACAYITPDLSAQMVNASTPADLTGVDLPCARCPVKRRCLVAGVESYASGVWGGEVLLDGHRAPEPVEDVSAALLALLNEEPRDRGWLHRRLGREPVAAALVALGDAVQVEGGTVRLAVEPVEEAGQAVECRPVARRRNERRDLARVARRAARRSRRVCRTSVGCQPHSTL